MQALYNGNKMLNCLTLWFYSWKNFLKKLILKKSAGDMVKKKARQITQ